MPQIFITHLLAISLFAAGGSCAFGQCTRLVPGQYPTIAAAVAVSQDGDTVLVAPGTYYERDISVLGKAICIRGAEGPETTVIDCGFLGRAFHVIVKANKLQPTRISGFTIRNGRLSSGSGGALFVQTMGVPETGGRFYLDNCHLLNNRSGGATSSSRGPGGALYSICGESYLSDCRFSDNIAGDPGSIGGANYDGRGGAAVIASQTIMVTGCEFINNRSGELTGSTESFSPSGGALWCRGYNVSVTRCEFRLNRSGSALYVGQGSALFIERSIAGSSSITVANCNFFGNRAGTTNSPLARNATGAVHIKSASVPTIAYCTFVSNHRAYGSPVLVGLSSGGAIAYTDTPSFAGLNLFKCIFLDCGASPIAHTSGLDVGPYSCFSDVPLSTFGIANFVGDPGLVDPFGGNLSLSWDSPCIDAGVNVSVSGMDIHGEARQMGANSDIGADEFTQGASTYPGTGEDLVLTSEINRGGVGVLHRKSVSVGSLIKVGLTSPRGEFENSPFVLAGSLIPTVPGPTTSFLAGVWLPLNFVIIADGITPSPGGFAPVLGAGGFGAQYLVPSSPAGSSVVIQGAVFSPMANNGVFAVSAAHEFVLGAPTQTFTKLLYLPILDHTDYPACVTSYPWELTSEIDVSFGAGTIRSLRVSLEVFHTYVSDMVFSLESPNGQKVLLSHRNGGEDDDLPGTSFTGSADPVHLASGPFSSAASPFNGIYLPDDLTGFNALYATSPNGTWKLHLSDRVDLDTGQIVSWSLEIGVQ